MIFSFDLKLSTKRKEHSPTRLFKSEWQEQQFGALLGCRRISHILVLIFKPVFEHWTGAHKPDRNTVLTFNTSQQCAKLLLLSLRLKGPESDTSSVISVIYRRIVASADGLGDAFDFDARDNRIIGRRASSRRITRLKSERKECVK